MADAQKKAFYTSKAKKLELPNEYTAAIRDYMRKGKVESVSKRNYAGKQGDKTSIIARKKGFSVTAVQVTLVTTAGELIEDGNATETMEGTWVYSTTVAVDDPADVVIKVTIRDVDGGRY